MKTQCWICSRPVPDYVGPELPVGWEHDGRDLRCPRHRREREAALATVGELHGWARARRSKKGLHGPSD